MIVFCVGLCLYIHLMYTTTIDNKIYHCVSIVVSFTSATKSQSQILKRSIVPNIKCFLLLIYKV